MPVNWRPTTSKIEQLIAQEETRTQLLQERKQVIDWFPEVPAFPVSETQIIAPVWQPTETPTFQLPAETPVQKTPIFQPVPVTIPQPEMPKPTPAKKEAPIQVPFWQRALQLFAAPFVWVNETIIKPGESLIGTAIGAVPEVEREKGEEFWAWKKRSWESWESPGIDINVPWSDKPMRIDVRGIVEFAPWLLLPGAGQVGAGVRAGAGMAGYLGKMGTIGKTLGYAVEYSPWGLVEKTAGAALKGTLKAVTGAGAKVSQGLEAKVFGKLPEPKPISPAVAKLTKFFGEEVIPAYRKFEEGLPALRAEQAGKIANIRKQFREGKITIEQKLDLEQQATAVGSLKAGFRVEVKKPAPVTPAVTLSKNELLKMVQEGEGKSAADAVGKFLDIGIETIETHRTSATLSIRLANLSKDNVDKINAAISRFESEVAVPGARLSPRVKLVEHPELQLGNRRQWEVVVDTVGLKEADISNLVWDDLFKVIKPQGKPILTVPSGEVAIPKAGAGMALFTKEEMGEFLTQIESSVEKGFVERDLSLSFRDFLLTGELKYIEPRHFRQLAGVFGNEFAQAVQKLRSVKPHTLEKVWDFLNIPRATLASVDLSATFRQGLILDLVRPQAVPRAFARQLKAFASEKLSMEMDDALRSRPLYSTLTDMGIEFTSMGKGARAITKEEPFYSNLAEVIPFVRRSERAFTTFLNEMRYSVGEAAYNAMTAQGASKSELKLMGNFINLAGGRGKLPANLDKFAPALNTVLFSAKYQMSTLQLPRQIGRMLISQNPYMRKEAAKALVTFVGGGVGLVSLLNVTGKAKMETDPRGSDFGKIVVGDTRIDIWRGYIQYARFAGQLLTGERKSAYGNMSKADRFEIAFRFAQGKASPALGLMIDLLKGETYQGDDILTSTKDTVRSFRERMMPLAIQDVIDAMEQNGTNALWTAAPAVLGVGVLTYINDFVKVKEKIAKQMGYETWDEIDPKTQIQIQNSSPELQAAQIIFDRRVMDTAWGQWRLAGKAIEDVFRKNVELATAQYRTTGDGVQFRGKIGDAFMARRGGYDARERDQRFEEQVKRLKIQDTAESLVSLGTEQMAIKAYQDALFADDMYDEFGDYRFDEAEIRKEQLRQALGDDLFKYVEEYMGAKFETLPPEFLELAKAKRALRPYWKVADRVKEMFGKRFAESNKGQSLITKRRQQMRKLDPVMEQYYQQFYKQV